MSRRPLRSPLTSRAVTACAFGLVVAVTSCGSRTGLLLQESGTALDAGAFGADASVDAPPDTVPCVPGSFTFDLATATLMFVLDRSGSMAFTVDGRTSVPPGTQSRWQLVRDALDQTISGFDTQIAMGAKFFPETMTVSDMDWPDRACRTESGVSIPPAPGHARRILDVFDTTSPRGGTPTAEAVRIAAQALGGTRTVARAMVLATDGAPNCNADLDPNACICTSSTSTCSADPSRGRYNCLDADRTVTTIRDVAAGQNIPVYVIGIGSIDRPDLLQVLDDMAVAGGRPRPTAPRHYNVQNASEMKDALAAIRDGVSKCTYLTPSAPDDPNAIAVSIDGTAIRRDPTHTSGWDWVDRSYGAMAFFGEACTRAQTGTPHITGTVACNP